MSASRSKAVRSRRPHGVTTNGASVEARRLAAAILEVLAGSRTPVDAARALDLSIPRYYQLEQRALAGFVLACERKPKGRKQTEARQVHRLEREVARLQKECGRQQALARLAQRAVGLPTPQAPAKPAASSNGKKSRKRRPAVRALRAARVLTGGLSSPAEGSGIQPLAGEAGPAVEAAG